MYVFLVMEVEKEPVDGDIAGGNLVTRASETSGNQGACGPACGPWVNPGWMGLRPWKCSSLPGPLNPYYLDCGFHPGTGFPTQAGSLSSTVLIDSDTETTDVQVINY